MPRYSRITIRAALVYLGLCVSLGALMLANEGLRWSPTIASWLPVHVDLLLFGWTTQLVFGVAYWILPRMDGRRGSLGLAVGAALLLNLGTAVLVLASLSSIPLASPIGMACAAAGGLLFAAHAWPRLRSLSQR